MKKIKFKKCLCLLFVAVCSVLFTTSLTAFAAHNEGGMEVTARIETVPEETSQPATDSGSTVVPDKDSVSTGEAISVCVVTSLLLLEISVLVIYMCNKNDKSRSKLAANDTTDFFKRK